MCTFDCRFLLISHFIKALSTSKVYFFFHFLTLVDLSTGNDEKDGAIWTLNHRVSQVVLWGAE